MICGVDEAGRGPVFGSLVITGACFHDDSELINLEVRDSKKLTAKRREDLAKKIKKISKSVKIIILTMLENELYIIDALKNNIEGFINKDSSMNELMKAIKDVYSGERYFNKEITDKVFEHIAHSGDRGKSNLNRKAILTNRQIEVIKLVAKGLTSKEVAQKLFLSELTVIKHRKNIIKKLELKNFTEVVSYAHREGII